MKYSSILNTHSSFQRWNDP